MDALIDRSHLDRPVRNVMALFPDGAEETIDVRSLGDNRYRIESIPMLTKIANYHDIIDAVETGPASITVLGRMYDADYCVFTTSYKLNRMISSDSESDPLAELTQIGGHWQIVFGGLLMIAFPPNRKTRRSPRR